MCRDHSRNTSLISVLDQPIKMVWSVIPIFGTFVFKKMLNTTNPRFKDVLQNRTHLLNIIICTTNESQDKASIRSATAGQPNA